MAGGRSVRFGAGDKLAEPFRGKPLLFHAVEALASVCTEVVVAAAAGTRDPDLPPGVPHVRVVHDRKHDAGPLEGLAVGLEEAGSELALAVAGDMPTLSGEILRELVRAVREENAEASVLRVGEDLPPIPSALAVRPAARAAAELLAKGASSLRDLMGALQVTAVSERAWRALDPSGATLRDIDAPEDLS